MSDVPLHTRELIERNDAEAFTRYRVAGGWLYRVLVYTHKKGSTGVALCFVPDAEPLA